MIWLTIFNIISMLIGVSTIPNGQGCLDNKSRALPYCDTALPMDKRVKDLESQLSLNEIISRLNSGSIAPAIPRIGLPAYNYRVEAVHGLEAYCIEQKGKWYCPTYFPITAGLAATFNRSVFYDMGRVIGGEARVWNNLNGSAKYRRPMGNSIRCPMVNILRDPRWGRADETASECPFILSEFGKFVVNGIQQSDENGFFLAIAEVKHFAVYNHETNRRFFNATVSAFDLMDSYFPPFSAAFRDAGALAYMCSDHALNSTPSCASTFLINHTARTKWGFNGFVESDCDSIRNIYKEMHLVATPEEAAALGINGGCDLDCGKTYNALIKAVEMKLTTEDAVRRAFRYAMLPLFRTGLFDPLNATRYSSMGLKEIDLNPTRAQSAANQSMVLLKNKGHILPFPKNKHVALIGPFVDSRAEIVGPVTIGPCSTSDTIINNNTYGNGYKGDYSCVPNLNETIRALGVAKKLNVVAGCNFTTNDTSGIAAAVKAAKEADYVVMVMGTSLAVVDEGHDLLDIKLPGSQEALIEAVVDVGKPTVVVLIMGNPMAIDKWIKSVPAVLNAFIPGTWGAHTIINTIFGNNMRFGKLPYTLYPSNYIDNVPLDGMSFATPPGRTYRYYTDSPVFPFGFGLSYTTFSLMPPTIKVLNFVNKEDKHQISIAVKNTGNQYGDEVVQVYMRPDKVQTDAPQPLRQLIDFQRISIDAGEEDLVTFTILCSMISLVDSSGNRALFPGNYTLLFSNGIQPPIEIVLHMIFKDHIIIDSL